jgi:hypothetical protein
MKNLNQFQNFDAEAFFAKKELTLTGVRDWKDYQSGEHRGKKLDAVITRDDTHYRKSKNGEDVTNLYEKLIIKVPHDISLPIGTKIELRGVEAKIYGDYHNKLSITAESVTVANRKEKPNA